MWHKAIWKGHPMRLELTRVGLLVELANHYTTRGASETLYVSLSKLHCLFPNICVGFHLVFCDSFYIFPKTNEVFLFLNTMYQFALRQIFILTSFKRNLRVVFIRPHLPSNKNVPISVCVCAVLCLCSAITTFQSVSSMAAALTTGKMHMK